MDINQLRNYLSVVEEGSFSKAALRCFISQSALSEQIQKLEDEVGAQLLDRSRRIIVPTGAGKIFIIHAQQVLAQIVRAKQEIQGLNESGPNTITLGISPTIAPYFLPRVLESFTVSHSDIEVMIYEEATTSLLQLVEAGTVDFGIVSAPISGRGFKMEELFSEELLVALPSTHPLADRPSLHLNQLRYEKFILMREGYYLGDQTLALCKQHNFRPKILIRTGHLDTIQSLIGAGLGISLVPRMAVLNEAEHICYCPLEKPQPRRTIATVWTNATAQNKTVQIFLNHLRMVGKAFKHPSTNPHSFILESKA